MSLSMNWTHNYETLISCTMVNFEERQNVPLSSSLLTHLLQAETIKMADRTTRSGASNLYFPIVRSRNIRLQYKCMKKIWYALFPFKKLTAYLCIALNFSFIRSFRTSVILINCTFHLADSSLSLAPSTTHDATVGRSHPLTPRCWKIIEHFYRDFWANLRYVSILHFR